MKEGTTQASSFRSRLLRRDLLVGTWIKTPAPVVCEVLCGSALDVLAIDAEHAPFGRSELDGCLAICRALGKPTLVRVPTGDSAQILNALDCGATGVVVPHVHSVAAAEAAVCACHYGRGGRGYAGSTRAAGFGGKPIASHMEGSRAATTVILQIEDTEALAVIDDIAAVVGVDCLFVGRIDLTVSLGKQRSDDPEVLQAVERICAAAAKASIPVGMFVADASEATRWIPRGASLFLLGSDQTFLLDGAAALVKAVR